MPGVSLILLSVPFFSVADFNLHPSTGLSHIHEYNSFAEFYESLL